MKRIIIVFVVCIICFLVLFGVAGDSHTKLDGKWYLYDGININTDIDIIEQLNIKDYMEISEGVVKDFRSNGKDGVSEFRIKGNEIHIGDSIYKYDINNIKDYKVLVLEVIGYDNGHRKGEIENGEKCTYIFDKNINLK